MFLFRAFIASYILVAVLAVSATGLRAGFDSATPVALGLVLPLAILLGFERKWRLMRSEYRRVSNLGPNELAMERLANSGLFPFLKAMVAGAMYCICITLVVLIAIRLMSVL